MSTLASRKCRPLAAGGKPLSAAKLRTLLAEVPDWKIEDGKLCRLHMFANHHDTMAFVNALAWISHRQDHHPDLAVGYNRCRIVYWTHSIGGLSENDFICAAQCDALFEP